MVGTIEPRKGHAFVLEAFDMLWKENMNIALVIIGKQGWMMDELVHKIQFHSNYNIKLFWFNDASDELVDIMYKKSTLLIAASEGEGFGLPLIEAGKYNIPILARDIPVFREVCGSYASYFENTNNPLILKEKITTCFHAYTIHEHSAISPFKICTWKQSAIELRELLNPFI